MTTTATLDVAKIVIQSLTVAEKSARLLQESVANFSAEKYAATIQDIPRFASLQLGSGVQVDAAIVFVDTRHSTDRALKVGAPLTNLTMHAFLPAMAFLVQEHEGYVVGFRGDGLFAAFGIDQSGVAVATPGEALKSAAVCAKAMIEAVMKVVNPILADRYDLPEMTIGTGVDFGKVVITRIGIQGAYEITAYGNAVNMAAKLSEESENEVYLSPLANDRYPSSPGGKVVASEVPDSAQEAYCLTFPTDYLV